MRINTRQGKATIPPTIADTTCGCSATQDVLQYGGVTAEPGRCIGCGTPVEPPKTQHAVNYTDHVTEYGITVRNVFKVF